MVTRGRIGDYLWAELPTESAEIREVVHMLGNLLEGFHAVNVSWDSGHMHELAPLPSGWSLQAGHVISPAITSEMVLNWPQSNCNSGRYDEWYFFAQPPVAPALRPFCNWGGVSLARSAELAFPGGFDLAVQLAASRPDIVIGDGTALFVIGDQAACSRFAEIGKDNREA